MKRDKTRLEDFTDEELDAFGEGARSLLVEAELRIRLARHRIAMTEEELEFRKTGKPKRAPEEWAELWHKEAENVAKICGVSLGDVGEVAQRLSKET